MASAQAASDARQETLTLGRVVPLDGEQTLELQEVTDSRCPLRERCAQRGYVTLLLHWRSAAQAAPMRLTLANTERDGLSREACLNGVRVRVQSVQPMREREPIAQEAYRVGVALSTCSITWTGARASAATTTPGERDKKYKKPT